MIWTTSNGITKSLRCNLSIIIIISSKNHDDSSVMKKLYVHDGSKQDNLYKSLILSKKWQVVINKFWYILKVNILFYSMINMI